MAVSPLPIDSRDRGVRAPRLLARVLTIRDVRDVERYVDAYLAALPLPDDELRAAVLGGIGDAYRIDRALPPERPLLPVLDVLLASRLARLAECADHSTDRVA
jgi:hypothetical protein